MSDFVTPPWPTNRYLPATFAICAVMWFAVPPTVFADEPSPSPIASSDHRDLLRGTLLAPRVFRAAAAKVYPSLVRIEGFGGVASRATAGFQPPGEGPTTGLIISPDGYILTSTFNFIRKPPVITVVLPGGERKIAKLLGRDETRKICVLKVDGVSDLPVPEFAPHAGAKVGQWAIAVGIGFGGHQPSLSAGIISATHRISARAVQTDANLSPANYGGPLVDIDGRVIGLCVPLSPQSSDAAAGAEWYDSGIGFAVPIADNQSRIAALKEGRNFEPAFLGIHVQSTGDPPTGAQVTEVVANSPAAKAGIVQEDEILAIDGIEVLDPLHLASLLGRFTAGDRISIELRRANEQLTVEVALGTTPARPEGSPRSEEPPRRAELPQ